MKQGQKFKFHYAWIIMICCFFIYGTSMGIGLNVSGIFNTAIAADLGWSISKFSACTIFMGGMAAVALTVTDKIFRKCDIRLVLITSISIYAGTIALKSVCSKVWQFCLLYAVNGAMTAFLHYVPVPLLISNWFKKKAGTALGISLFSSGILGAVMNPVLSQMIENHGWRYATVANGIIIAAFSVPFIAIFVRKTPEEMGLKPYGAEDKPASPMIIKTSPSEVDPTEDYHVGVTPSEKKKFFRYSLVIAFIAYLVSSLSQQFAHFASVNGISAGIGATLVTIWMIGNMTGKLCIGAAADRFGKRKTVLVSFSLAALGFMLLCMGIRFTPLLFAGAFLGGISAPNNAVVMPLVISEYSKGDEYLYYVSKVTISTMVSTAFGTYICGAIYDLTGSYAVEFLLYAALTVTALVFILKIIKKNRGKA